MADNMQKLIQHLKRIEKNTKVPATVGDDITGTVRKHFSSTIKLARAVLRESNGELNYTNIEILGKAGFKASHVNGIATSKGRIHF